MSRSGYSDGYDSQQLAMWRGQVASAIRGKRGQAFLRDLAAALDAMPAKRLIAAELQNATGEVCALGSLGTHRGHNMRKLDPGDYDRLAKMFDVAAPLVQETEWMNDEAYCRSQSPERRWERMREWVRKNLKSTEAEGASS